MKEENGRLIYSPSDLIVFMESEFASWMDRFSREAPNKDAVTKNGDDPSMSLLAKMGDEHEKRFLQHLLNASKDVFEITPGPDACAQTLAAMHDGRAIIYQGELKHDNFAGRSDFLVKVAGASKLGDFHYEVWDTKLARKPKPYFLIQLCCYAELLEATQGRLPESIAIVLGDSTEKRFRTADYLYYYRQLKAAFLTTQANFDHRLPPIPNGMADHGRWSGEAEKVLERIDHLSRVANIRSVQIKKLEKADIAQLQTLAASKALSVPKMEAQTFATLKTQARLQLESEGLERPKFELNKMADAEARRGLSLLAPASKNDVFFDMEGYPYVDGGLEYLFGASFFERGKLKFRDFWGHDRAQERIAFEQFVDWVYQRWQADPTMHIYHYADYEVSALRRLMGRHATREVEVDDMLRNEVFINLYTVVRQAIQVGTPSYSIKKIEQLYREKRDTDVASATDSIVFYQNWLEANDGNDPDTSKILKQIRDYNKDDCDSTAQLADWLRQVQTKNKIAWVPPPPPKEPNEEAAAARDEAAALAQEILADLPKNEEQARIHRMLAHLLEFHWRETRPVWWAMFDRHDMTEDQLIHDVNCLGALRRTKRAAWREDRSQVYEYAFDSSQDTKLDAGDSCFLAHNLAPATILTLDEDRGLVAIKIGNKQGVPPKEVSLIPNEYVNPQKIADSIFRTVSQWRKTGKLPAAIIDFLLRNRPKLKGNPDGPVVRPGADITKGIIDAVNAMDRTTLCIQGPPGSGKTYNGAKIIVDLLRKGKRIGVTSNSHRAIAKLLKDVDTEAKISRLKFRGTKIQSDTEDFGLEGTSFTESGTARDAFAGGGKNFNIVGGTAWAFSDKAAVGALDYLFVDEAGQVSVANLLGMAPSTDNVILMGDQMQLSQPIKGSHPEESGQSTLEYLLQEKQTIADDFGVFLSKTYRMHPDVCSFISSSVYEDRLHAVERTAQRRIVIPKGCERISKGSGIIYVPVEHEGNTQGSDEEADVISEVICELMKCKFHDEGAERPLAARDILVVAPYNMQVRTLKNRHQRDCVGTVDKFQGQEAPIVIVSMCASDGNESPRGLEFLFNKNRLNVAISRAKCLAIVVGSPRLAHTACARVEQIEMVNLFCRIVEEGGRTNTIRDLRRAVTA